MDGVHDLGGMQGFGAVERERNEPVFHAPWEAAVVAMMRAGGARGLYNIDEFRHAIERMKPAEYLSATYYEKWLDGITRLLIEKGAVKRKILFSQGSAPEGNAIEMEQKAFIEAVRNGTPPPVTGEEGLNALKVATEILEKMGTR